MVRSLDVRRAAAPLVVGALVVLGAACSHDLSLDDWVVRADAVCRQQQAAADADPAPPSPLPGDELRHLAQQSRTELDALRDLPPLEERRSSVAEYLLTLEHRIDVLGNFADELDKAPADGPEPDRGRLEDVTTQATTQAVALGLESCGGGVDLGTVSTSTTEAVLSGGAGVTDPPASSPDDDEIVTQDGPG